LARGAASLSYGFDLYLGPGDRLVPTAGIGTAIFPEWRMGANFPYPQLWAGAGIELPRHILLQAAGRFLLFKDIGLRLSLLYTFY